MYYENWYTLCDHLTRWFIYDEMSFFWLSEVRIQLMVTPFLLASGLVCIMLLAWHSNQWNHNNRLVYGRGLVDKCSITNDVGIYHLTWLQLSLFFFHPTTVFTMCQWHGPTWRGRNGNKDLGLWFMDCEPAFTPSLGLLLCQLSQATCNSNKNESSMYETQRKEKTLSL